MFTCNIDIKSHNTTAYPLQIKYGDGRLENKNFDMSSHLKISNAYTTDGLFTIDILINDRNMSLNPQIYVLNNSTFILTNTTNETSFQSLVYSYADYADYIGCFSEVAFQNQYDNVFNSVTGIETPYKCMEFCMEHNYNYVIISQNGKCDCSTKYGMINKLEDTYCKCICSMSSDNHCGCEKTSIVYKIRYDKMFDVIQANYLGCYTFDFTYNDSRYISYNTNGLCLDYCRSYGYSYFSTFNGFYCNCENENITLSFSKIGKCNYPCAGNRSQICGGYFGPRSFYKISTRNIHLTSISNQVGKINENLTFKLESNFSNDIEAFEIDLGDNDRRNLEIVNHTIYFDKKYTEKGLYTIKIKRQNFEYCLKVDVLITNGSIIERNRLSNKDIYIYGKYVVFFIHDTC
ncbi:unnamed protein product [Brachionus calyciflorus]|uniref:WSC domain-containing protein n=1 Tax=Brachionus calyciflorus TaxID=104777 RepID=A0A814CVH2_9BILA|nr:unnamed protein product [Brachionus calyciflorus]